MYLYLLAPFLKDKKYSKELSLFEGRIADFGISGKVAQLSQFLKFQAAVKEFGAKKVTTLVVVGDDALFEEAVGHAALSQLVVGYIPMGENRYGGALGIPVGSAAVEVLAARRISKLDLGRVENRFFLGNIHCEGKGIELHSPTFSIFPKEYASIDIINMDEAHYPETGRLAVEVTPFEGSFFKKKPGVSTTLSVTSCRLKSAKSLPASIGAHTILKLPLQVDVAPKAVRVIVGRRIESRGTYPITRNTNIRGNAVR